MPEMPSPSQVSHNGEQPLAISTEPPDDSPLLDGLERFSEMLDELYDELPGTDAGKRRHPFNWEGNFSKTACRSLVRLNTKWRRIARIDRPPPDLIVRIAHRLQNVIDEIGQHPRRILQRQR